MMKRVFGWLLRRLDLVRGAEHRLEVFNLERRVELAEHRMQEAEKARDVAVITERRAIQRLTDLRKLTGVHQKWGGVVDVDYDQLCRALGRDNCAELKACVDDYLKGANAPRKRSSR